VNGTGERRCGGGWARPLADFGTGAARRQVVVLFHVYSDRGRQSRGVNQLVTSLCNRTCDRILKFSASSLKLCHPRVWIRIFKSTRAAQRTKEETKIGGKFGGAEAFKDVAIRGPSGGRKLSLLWHKSLK